ncbi:MAG TPA: isocitrate/isopropylmalate family dehydrogenase [Aggregatilineales bacterium]|nr:isocitrate/isopropylmalate family dehydrogenase [Aggregatilineales bacterium]
MSNRTVVVMKGDQTGQELLLEGLRVLNAIRYPLDFLTFDLSLTNRRATNNKVVHEAAEAASKYGLGIKAATITPEQSGDVGSPNALLREAIGGEVILRTGRRIPSVRPFGGVHAPITVVRMAVGDAYNAKEWREGEGLDESAFRTEKLTRRTCRAVAEYAFRHARKVGAKVFGGPKFTVSPVYEGMFKEELDAASTRYPDVRYDPQLIDATYALLLDASGEALVIPCLNRDGDVMSDLVIKMFGSIAGAESQILGFHPDGSVRVAVTEAPHGTAPTLEGKNVANPMAMILAAAALLNHIDDPRAARASRVIYEATLEAVKDGVKTADLGGHATTTEFTDEVIRRVSTRLEVLELLP